MEFKSACAGVTLLAVVVAGCSGGSTTAPSSQTNASQSSSRAATMNLSVDRSCSGKAGYNGVVIATVDVYLDGKNQTTTPGSAGVTISTTAGVHEVGAHQAGSGAQNGADWPPRSVTLVAGKNGWVFSCSPYIGAGHSS